MKRAAFMLMAALAAIPAASQMPVPKLSFEVASIKPSTPGDRTKFATMQGGHQFAVRNYRVKDLVAFAYNLPRRLVSGGPAWADTDSYNILAATRGEAPPDRDGQMAMCGSCWMTDSC
jgi:uncharacterized protein (TIGR03435 family)